MRPDRRDGRDASVALVELQERIEIDVGHAVAVGGKEVARADEPLDLLDSAAGRRFLTRVGKRDRPARIMGVGEEVAKAVAAVPDADHEVSMPVCVEDLHDVPEDRLGPHAKERLGRVVSGRPERVPLLRRG